MEYSYDRCPNLVYFSIPLLITCIYFSAIETPICNTEIEVNRVCFLRFCTKYLTWYSKYSIELIVTLSSINTTKKRKRKLQGNPDNQDHLI